MWLDLQKEPGGLGGHFRVVLPDGFLFLNTVFYFRNHPPENNCLPESFPVSMNDVTSPLSPVQVQLSMSRRPPPQKLSSSFLKVALSWDFYGSPIDLDCSAVAFDSIGNIVSAVYYNEKSALSGALTHSGDSADGKADGDDESIVIDTAKLLQAGVAAVALVVTCSGSGDFTAVESAVAQIRDAETGLVLHETSVGQGGGNTAAVIGVIHVAAGATWMFSLSHKMSKGPREFNAAKETLREEVGEVLGIDEGCAMERGEDAVFNMAKGEAMSVEHSDCQIGVGWTAFCTDLDVCALIFREDGSRSTVSFSNLSMYGVTHSGDSIDGAGPGDDETISVDFSLVPSDVYKIVFTVSVFGFCGCAPWPLSSFLAVPYAHVNLYSGSGKSDLSPKKKVGTFNCSVLQYGPVNNIVIAALERDRSSFCSGPRTGWKFHAKGNPVCTPVLCCSGGGCVGDCCL